MLKINRGKNKIFCIGRNKTGTTSLEQALKEFGYKLGNQKEAELLIKYYKDYNWKPIIRYCKKYEAFQDVPFSWPYTWLILHQHFPNAKFILTYREEEAWYKSLTSFHSKLFADGNRIPNKEDLQNAMYRYKGFMWEANRVNYKTPENDPYNKTLLITHYKRHNEDILHYFKGSQDFLALDISQPNSYHQLCEFLEKKPLHETFPHLNKTNS
ncbi:MULTISPECIES: sulfotransferase [Mesonia]|uniref:Uncharacterized protein n=1 Tax=Mesonia oceanica TaxID=2687242 RepID=A0AC61Y9Y5_9FLAO|nr:MULTISPECIES: sulfotransferase [Mesonia]MAN26639.1 hypothetical protein [Mesonia sp.]MAQ40084.1 hypothetical protein [Mesonia sp.]MBJ96614.1 hypothetical protein [Flavobacteriaceae bacterium]VVV01307.1 hypothetical protein FVB9532_02597 [Mesonia oceanica]|tara:strand:- start:41558 stop:42193 length:636 start_codon:yes stop_codon:yes gene_type:complete